MEEIAEVYSRSLFEVASEHGDLDRVHEELGEFADALDENRDLQVFFFSPYFSSQEKKDAHRHSCSRTPTRASCASSSCWPSATGCRRSSASGAASTSSGARRTSCCRSPSRARSSSTRRLVEGIGKRIEEQTGQKVELTSKVDPDVLGGLVLQVGNMVLDASVRTRLEKLRKNVARAV